MFKSPEKEALRLISQSQEVSNRLRKAAHAIDSQIEKSCSRTERLIQVTDAVTDTILKGVSLFQANVMKVRKRMAGKRLDLFATQQKARQLADNYDRLING